MQFKALTLQLLSLSVALFGLTGCPDLPKKQEAPNPRKVENDWNVDGTSVTCSTSECPNALGVLLSVTRKETYSYTYKTIETSVGRCTATLINSRQLVTAGHCIKTLPNTNIYFRTVSAPGRPSRTFKVKSIAAKAHTEESAFAKDFAILNLASPAEGYDYFVAPIEGSYSDLRHLTAYVINQPVDWDNYRFKLDAVNCQMQTESFFPDVAHLPAVFGVDKCHLVSGNSGGPVVAPHQPRELLGVLSKSSEADGVDESKRGRNEATLSNAACISLAGWSKISATCLDVSTETIVAKAYEKILRSIVKSIFESWTAEGRSTIQVGGVEYRAIPFLVSLEHRVPDESSAESAAALLPLPQCVLSGSPTSGSAKAIPMLREFIPASGKVNVRPISPISVDANLFISGSQDLNVSWVFSLTDSKWKQDDEANSNLITGSPLNLEPCRGDELEVAARKMIDDLLNATNSVNE